MERCWNICIIDIHENAIKLIKAIGIQKIKLFIIAKRGKQPQQEYTYKIYLKLLISNFLFDSI